MQQGRCACTRLRVRNCHRTRHSRTHNKTGVRAHVCSHVTFTECIILVRATRQVCVHTFAQTLMSQNASLLYVQQGRRACTCLLTRDCHRMHHSLACNKESPILYYKKHDHPCPLYPCSTSTISMSRLAPPTGAPHFTCTTQTTQLKPCPPSPMQCWTALMLSCCALKPALGRSQLRLSVPWTASAAAQR